MAVRVEPFAKALRDLSDTLAPRGIDWAVAGAVAANNYRDETRTTNDLDVLLVLSGNDLADVQDALEDRGWTTTGVADGFLLRMQHSNAGRIDMMVSGTDYEAAAVARAHRVDYEEHLSFKMLAVEDVVILKLIANRWRDNADVESILVAQPDFDREYMARWFDEFDLAERFRRIENEATAGGLLSRCRPRGPDLARPLRHDRT